MSINLNEEIIETIDDNDEDITVKAKICNDCETIHYIHNDILIREFPRKNMEFKYVPMVTDYEVALNKKNNEKSKIN